MLFSLEGLPVYFPYPHIYPEQYKYMLEIKRALDVKGHGCLEMPTGTGKTISLLAVITSYQLHHPEVGKLIYCTRTVPEMEKVLAELKNLVAYRSSIINQDKNNVRKQLVDGARAQAIERAESREDNGDVVMTNANCDNDRDATGVRNSDSNGESMHSGNGQPKAVPENGNGNQVKEIAGCKPGDILALGLSSRKNMCIHEVVSDGNTRESVDAQCRKLTASWVRAKAAEAGERADGGDEIVETCSYFEQYEQYGAEELIPPGVYTLADLRLYGQKHHYCPYFLVRHMLTYANVIVYNYQYMLDPKVSQLVSRQLEREAIVVFDEAHNIDSICIEALSVNIRNQTLDGASRNLTKLTNEIEKVKERDAQRLRDEYNRLVRGLTASGTLPSAGTSRVNNNESQLSAVNTSVASLADDLAEHRPVIPDDIIREAIPGNIRRAEHFVSFLRKFVMHLRDRLDTEAVQKESPALFLSNAASSCGIDGKTLRFCYDRLTSLIKTLEISNADEFISIHLVADFATLVGTYSQGFAVIVEPFDERNPSVPDPVIQLCCLDASLAIKPVFEKYQSVIITSGTLSPIDLYPRLLNFNPVAIQSFPMSLTRDCICPLVVTRGSDEQPISTKFEMRGDANVIRNYGRLVIDMASAVPDGLVCFFVSYRYMDNIISMWDDQGILRELSEQKLIFVETTDVVETTLALKNYRRACDCGRGAVFFSVARGKVAEGIDFDRHYGRAVIMFGVPYQYTLSRVLRARLEYLRETFQIQENDFLSFDAIRQTSQCVGRVIRSKADYGLMIFADKRYNRRDKRDKLPQWITSCLKDSHLNLSTGLGMEITRDFMRTMAQPISDTGLGRSLLSAEHLKKVEMYI